MLPPTEHPRRPQPRPTTAIRARRQTPTMNSSFPFPGGGCEAESASYSRPRPGDFSIACPSTSLSHLRASSALLHWPSHLSSPAYQARDVRVPDARLPDARASGRVHRGAVVSLPARSADDRRSRPPASGPLDPLLEHRRDAAAFFFALIERSLTRHDEGLYSWLGAAGPAGHGRPVAQMAMAATSSRMASD